MSGLILFFSPVSNKQHHYQGKHTKKSNGNKSRIIVFVYVKKPTGYHRPCGTSDTGAKIDNPQ